jgi:tetratricopeptide (TPR) repeat protein
LAIAVLALAGCAPKDGLKELDEARSAMELKDYVKAKKYFAKSLEYSPGRVDALVGLVQALLSIGEIDDAAKAIDKAVTLRGEDVDVKLLDAEVAWHQKDYAKAKRIFAEVANDGKLDAPLRSQGWSSLGVVELADEQRDNARISFLRAIRINRHNAAAWYHLGLLYRDCGYAEAALEQFEIFVRISAEADQRVQKVLRSVIPDLKDSIARAAADRPGASRRDSAASAAAISKAEAEWKKGNYRRAQTHYQDALKSDVLSYPAAYGLAKSYLKNDTSKNGQVNALNNYRIACSLRPSSVRTFIEAGALAMKLSYYAQAVEIYSRAFAANPQSLEAIDGLIRALGKSGKSKAARAYQQYRDSLSAKRK